MNSSWTEVLILGMRAAALLATERLILSVDALPLAALPDLIPAAALMLGPVLGLVALTLIVARRHYERRQSRVQRKG